jgi:REP element-mobilizing transposase RayT
MAKQLSLFKDPRKNTKRWWIVKQTTYGGSLNYRKVARPFDRKKLVHVVLKAKLGRALWFTRFAQSHRKTIEQSALRYKISLRDLAINHDHIHLLYSAKSRELNAQFLRFLSAELGRKQARLRRKIGLRPERLWTQRPFSRLVSWATRSVQAIQRYIHKNRQEALGFIEFTPRKHRLSAFLAVLQNQLRHMPA